MRFDVTGRRRYLGCDPLHCIQASRRHVHHTRRQAGRLQVKGPRKARRAPAVLNQDKGVALPNSNRRAGSLDERAKVFFGRIRRPAKQHPAGTGRAEPLLQLGSERMVRRGEGLPAGGVVRSRHQVRCGRYRPRSLHQLHDKAFGPNIHPRRLPWAAFQPAATASLLQLLQRTGHVRHSGIGEIGQPQYPWQLEPSCGFGHQLANRDGVQVQVA